MSAEFYSVGWSELFSLRETLKEIQLVQLLPNSAKNIIICEKEEKSMQVLQTENGTTTKIIFDQSNLNQGDSIRLPNNFRWEGDTFKGEAFGYGCMYDQNNQLIYKGYVYGGKKVCSGEEYYPDVNTVHYQGHFINGLRHGYGVLYDKEGNIEYSGDLAFDKPVEVDLQINDFCEDDNLIHNSVETITIGNYCYNTFRELHLKSYRKLLKLKIGHCSFKDIESFVIDNCNALTQIQIGEDSFNKAKNITSKKSISKSHFCISFCSALAEVTIGQYSFGDFNGKVSLHRIITLYLVNRSSFIANPPYWKFHG